MDWEKLRLFHTVAEAKSFTAAAQVLNASQSALSRQIKSLEESLNTALFTRHARGLVLTQEGEQLFQTATEVLKKIENTQQQLLEAKQKPFGVLRITATVSFGSLWLAPRLKEFLKHYPDIDIQLMLSDDLLDLSTGAADVAIRFVDPGHADLIQRPMADFHHHIYASPKYLSERGTPETIDDLVNHEVIAYGPTIPSPIKNINWLVEATMKAGQGRPRLAMNNLFGVLQALKSGAGIAAIPDYLAASSPELVRVLRNVEGPKFTSYLVYAAELRQSKRINAFKEFLYRWMKEDEKLL